MASENARKRGWKTIYKSRAKTILNELLIGPIYDEDATAFLREIVGMHPESAAKIGAGIARFEIRPSEVNPSQRTFWIIRVDGTETDFSYLKCITHPTPIQDFKAACRSAVVREIIDFKNRTFDPGHDVVCRVTGELLSPDTSHIDHAPPWTFDAIAEAFAEGRDLVASVRPTMDGECRTVFSGPAIEAEFIAFHNERADLRAVSIRANLSVLTRKGATP
jgi:hypothetical protein